ncbi:hypothetical protein QWY77_05300 [Thalassotalea ponticola]|uniref:hypothetical protein n=1 Tax=Thalassotalea ponticola TaxID=1523392 RepID=UPI0025B295E0|nr:hypothetical protein [Thalassotalea ponticola]MDN3652178.1 hypothetical protein [Thalassotalea ponticola]
MRTNAAQRSIFVLLLLTDVVSIEELSSLGISEQMIKRWMTALLKDADNGFRGNLE